METCLIFVEEMQEMRNLFLIGFMGCGKSSVARHLSKVKGMSLVEMDQMLEDEAGMSITDLFAQYGETHFRDMETELIKDIQSKESQVVSCGGGVVLRPQNVEEMKKSGKVIWLAAKPETILMRIKDDEKRPLLQGNKNLASIEKMMRSRQKNYESAADFIIWTDGKRIEDICNEIIAYLN